MSKKTKEKDVAADLEEEEGGKGGKKKLLIVALVAVLAIGAGAYFFLFSGGSAEAAAPEPGTQVAIDPVAINLAGGSYLKLGMTLQLTAEASAGGEGSAAPTGAKALDLAIAQFSGASLSDVQTNRAAMKAALLKSVEEAYDNEVMDIYFTEYVTQ